MQLLLILVLLILPVQSGFTWVSFNMTKRSNINGMTSKMTARVFYHKNGTMVTYFTSPTELFILNNLDGEINFYNPKENSVFRTFNQDYGTQNTTFYHFLSGNSEDLGLGQIGYSLSDSHVENMHLISFYEPPRHLKNKYGKIELVSNGTYPVFIGYYNTDGEYMKKIFYSNFKKVGVNSFPFSITEIDYVQSDSTITKTTFGEFEYDNAADKEIVFFKVPENARLIE